MFYVQVVTFCVYNLQFLQLHLDPASSNILPASGDGSIAQKLRVTNSQHGKVCLSMQIQKGTDQQLHLLTFKN